MFDTNSNHDAIAQCVSYMDYLQLEIAMSHLAEYVHDRMVLQEDGSLTACGTIKYFSAETTIVDVRNQFVGFTVRHLSERKIRHMNHILDSHLDDNVLFTVRA